MSEYKNPWEIKEGDKVDIPEELTTLILTELKDRTEADAFDKILELRSAIGQYFRNPDNFYLSIVYGKYVEWKRADDAVNEAYSAAGVEKLPKYFIGLPDSFDV